MFEISKWARQRLDVGKTTGSSRISRPKKARTRAVDEIPRGATKLRRYGIVIHCSVCGGEGHNATNCGRADNNTRSARGRGMGRGINSVHQSQEELQSRTIRRPKLQANGGGLTRIATTAVAPTNVASHSLLLPLKTLPRGSN
ncbi:unnamed protein product [Prunus armeniaca]|uniref:Uncharacterized protein n=1 Tax=Prunus armeniaca TaxID=36596 RepID=A0A6J5UB65_PRUAR|nr:unnamed protein product [Prunus armeniaca]CAB4304050.1 unnamed protein product [Prunus armeniaca]